MRSWSTQAGRRACTCGDGARAGGRVAAGRGAGPGPVGQGCSSGARGRVAWGRLAGSPRAFLASFWKVPKVTSEARLKIKNSLGNNASPPLARRPSPARRSSLWRRVPRCASSAQGAVVPRGAGLSSFLWSRGGREALRPTLPSSVLQRLRL